MNDVSYSRGVEQLSESTCCLWAQLWEWNWCWWRDTFQQDKTAQLNKCNSDQVWKRKQLLYVLCCSMMSRINRNLFWSAKKDDAGDYTLGLHKVFNPEDRQPDLHTGIQDQAQIQANVHQCIRMVSDLICGQEERKERSINGECNNVNHRYINNTF